MCACGKPLCWNSKTYTYIITFSRTPLTTISSFNSSNFDLKTLASKSRRSCAVYAGKNSFWISSNPGLHVIVMNKSRFPNFWTNDIASKNRWIISRSFPQMMKVEWFYVQHFLNIRWKCCAINKCMINIKLGKLQITPLNFGGVWILYSKVSKFGFCPLKEDKWLPMKFSSSIISPLPSVPAETKVHTFINPNLGV